MAPEERRSGVVVLVDDDPEHCTLLQRWLQRSGYGVEVFHDGDEFLAGLAYCLPDVVCLDLSMPGSSGLETLKRIRERQDQLPVVILTGDSSVETVVETMQAGAYNYLTKPIGRTKLLATIANAVDRHRMGLRLAQLEREAAGRGFGDIIGSAPAMREVFRQMDRVARSELTVLIQGESGTGKELVARALHAASTRSAGPFVALNCAAIPENLQESELFGHEKGSFTGASSRRIGRFEQAHGGTLFLDEVAELSAPLQAKLLRAIQERTFQRVGGSEEIRSDFRLVAATHRDLADRVRLGGFREDLYFRLAVFELEVPPLRERREDLPLLIEHFLNVLAGADTDLRVTPEALDTLAAHAWPGNVRELENAMQRAIVLARDGEIRPEDFPRRVRGTPGTDTAIDERLPMTPATASAVQAAGEFESIMETNGNGAAPLPSAAEIDPKLPAVSLADLEQRAIEEALERCNGSLSAVGRELGIARTTLYRKLKKYGIRV